MSEREIVALSARVGNIESRQSEIGEAVVEHKTRLQNGVNVFSDQKKRIENIEKKIEPKPPSVYKIIGITISLMVAGAGSLWALANMLRDRPTVEQIDKVIDHHDSSGHNGMKSDIRAVQVEQGAQRTMIEAVQLEQSSQGDKLDTLIQRTPEPPPPKVDRKNRNR